MEWLLERVVSDLDWQCEPGILRAENQRGELDLRAARSFHVNDADRVLATLLELVNLDIADDRVGRIEEEDQVLVSREVDVVFRRGDGADFFESLSRPGILGVRFLLVLPVRLGNARLLLFLLYLLLCFFRFLVLFSLFPLLVFLFFFQKRELLISHLYLPIE